MICLPDGVLIPRNAHWYGGGGGTSPRWTPVVRLPMCFGNESSLKAGMDSVCRGENPSFPEGGVCAVTPAGGLNRPRLGTEIKVQHHLQTVFELFDQGSSSKSEAGRKEA